MHFTVFLAAKLLQAANIRIRAVQLAAHDTDESFDDAGERSQSLGNMNMGGTRVPSSQWGSRPELREGEAERRGLLWGALLLSGLDPSWAGPALSLLRRGLTIQRLGAKGARGDMQYAVCKTGFSLGILFARVLALSIVQLGVLLHSTSFLLVNIKVLEANPSQTRSSPSNGAVAGGEDGWLCTIQRWAGWVLCWQNLAFWIRAHTAGSSASLA
ncbi:hypothetical protein TARUN_212 [Trichoderma arundinaceum]|uniref:Uncharacterized protein n=1 Tax=Trichoderma arundinaceum TaxID=490622 RepID=A0A395P107_TRIAR|nr:hypothetical protein TARUN_212 [Trichoderma arundinaceum]